MDAFYFARPVVFLLRIVFEFYLLAIMLRFLLQCVRADFYNPVSQFIVKITSPVLVPLRRLLPGVGGVDFSAIVLMLFVALLQVLLITLIVGRAFAINLLISTAVADLVALLLNVYLFSIFIQVIISWVAPHQYNPIIALIRQLTDPVMRPLRRVLPPVGMFDFSPLVAIVLIQLLKMILLPPLPSLYVVG